MKDLFRNKRSLGLLALLTHSHGHEHTHTPAADASSLSVCLSFPAAHSPVCVYSQPVLLSLATGVPLPRNQGRVSERAPALLARSLSPAASEQGTQEQGGAGGDDVVWSSGVRRRRREDDERTPVDSRCSSRRGSVFTRENANSRRQTLHPLLFLPLSPPLLFLRQTKNTDPIRRTTSRLRRRRQRRQQRQQQQHALSLSQVSAAAAALGEERMLLSIHAASLHQHLR